MVFPASPHAAMSPPVLSPLAWDVDLPKTVAIMAVLAVQGGERHGLLVVMPSGVRH
jgi:uncharacterized ion transporter superfamily protein YfcC